MLLFTDFVLGSCEVARAVQMMDQKEIGFKLKRHLSS